jgi:hypothetical protein
MKDLSADVHEFNTWREFQKSIVGQLETERQLTRIYKTVEKLKCSLSAKNTSEAHLAGFGLPAHTRERMWLVAKVWQTLCYRGRTVRTGI